MIVKVNIKRELNGAHLGDLNIMIKHFRQREAKSKGLNPLGGNTILFATKLNIMAYSTCRPDEKFVKRKGILVALQKLLDKLPGEFCTTKSSIAQVEWGCNEITVYLANCKPEERFWYL